MTAQPQPVVYLALGANLGDRRANLAAAVERLRPHVAVEAVSGLYETEPAYVLDQPRYLNAALRGRTSLAPRELLVALKQRLEQADAETCLAFAVLESHLRDNLQDDHLYGSSEVIRSERARIVYELNRLALNLVGPSFNELCGG